MLRLGAFEVYERKMRFREEGEIVYISDTVTTTSHRS